MESRNPSTQQIMYTQLPPANPSPSHFQSSDEVDSDVDLDLDWRVFARNNTAEYFQTSELYHPQSGWYDQASHYPNTSGRTLYQHQHPSTGDGRYVNPNYDDPDTFGVSLPYSRDLEPSMTCSTVVNPYPQPSLTHNGLDYYRHNSPDGSILSSASGSGYQSPFPIVQYDNLGSGAQHGSSYPDTTSSSLSRSPTISLQYFPHSPEVYVQNEDGHEHLLWSKDIGIDPGKIQPQRIYQERPSSAPFMPDVESRQGSCVRDLTLETDVMTAPREHLRDMNMTEDYEMDDEMEEPQHTGQTTQSEDDSDYSPSRAKPKHTRRGAHTHRRRSCTLGNNLTAKSPKLNSSAKVTKRTNHTRNHNHGKHHSRTSSAASSSLPSTTHTTSAASIDSTAPSKRPFTCPLTPYGCTSDFATKNEWKRHTTSQHLRLGFWRCDLCPDRETRPNDFNRKDLFTQHLRRMHMGNKKGEVSVLSAAKGQGRQDEMNKTDKSGQSATKNKVSAVDAALAATRTRCWTGLRMGPTELRCAFCDECFTNGKQKKGAVEQGADEWLEHVGRHLATACGSKTYGARGKVREDRAGEVVEVDWEKDELLRGWMVSEGLLVPASAQENAGYVLVERGCGR